MKLPCSVSIGNRLLPVLAIKSNKKHVKSTLALCKNPKSSDYCLIHFSVQNKNGNKYELKNINKVLTRFVNEGKTTIQFAAPPHDLYIQADPIHLKSFLHLLKRAMEKKISDKELTCSSISVTASSVKAPPTKLRIQNRSEYPLKGFPRTLESLYINNIQRCSLDRGILQLIKLRHLDLSHNCIENIPTELSNLPCLSELIVSHNELGKSSLNQWDWLGGRLAKTLKLLDLKNNNLKYLPNQLVKLYSLISLHVDFNEIRSLPSGIGNLRHLQVFTAANNQLSILPGSTKKWRLHNLDLSNNNFNQNEQSSPAAIFPKPLPVGTLKEYAARRVLNLQLHYTNETLPRTVMDYLDSAKYCICGNACFNLFIRQPHMLLLTMVAQSFSVSSDEFIYVPADCYFCSLKCFGCAHHGRIRYGIIR